MKPDRLEAGVSYLHSCGYRVKLGRHVREADGFLAGSDQARADDLMAMFSDPEVRAIFCTRGGYGTPRLLDRIDYSVIRENPKILVGYSDLTALQLAIWRHARLITFSGPMVAVEMALGIDPFTEQWFWRTMTSPEPLGPLAGHPGSGLEALSGGRAEGRLLGGCLSLVGSLVGTPYEPDWHGAILLAEEIQEDPYRVDRWLAQMRHAGVLDQIAGVVLGQFIDCVPTGETPSLPVEEILKEYLAGLSVPVLSGFPYGHGNRKYTVPIGVECRMDAERGVVEFVEGALV
jgi:muramoyltetrapeptide carboxypeptidase